MSEIPGFRMVSRAKRNKVKPNPGFRKNHLIGFSLHGKQTELMTGEAVQLRIMSGTPGTILVPE
jgi:hypothetical protein